MLGKFPRQLIFNRRLKTDLPTASPLLESSSVGMHDIPERLKTRKYQQKNNYDAHAGKKLRDLYPVESTVTRHDNKQTPNKTQFSKIVHSANTVRKAIPTEQTGIRPIFATFLDKPEVDDIVIPLPSEKTDVPLYV